MNMKRFFPVLGTLILAGLATAGVEPVPFINFQGVLRDASDNPLEGGHDMIFRFFDAETLGNEILVDEHLAAGTGAVEVTGGMFSSAIGGGNAYDGSGPGTYATLAEVFRDHDAVYLEVEVYNPDLPGWETLAPRTRALSSAYALNADHLDGTNGDQLLRSDTSDIFSAGTLTIGAGATLDGIGTVQAGAFVDRDDASYYINPSAIPSGVLYGDLVLGAGSDIDSDHLYFDTGYEALTWDDGQTRFEITDELAVRGPLQAGSTTYAPVGYSRIGTSDPSSGQATGTSDLFVSDDLEVGGSAFLSRYVYMEGQASGSEANQYIYFFDGGSRTGESLSWNDTNDEFRLTDDLYITDAWYGVEASGSFSGGFFKDSDASGQAFVGRAGYGIYAEGNDAGGYFDDTNNTTYTWVAYGGYGIYGRGSTAGGYFSDTDGADSGLAYVGHGDRGIWGKGDFAGATFSSPDNTTVWADVAQRIDTTNYKIRGNGTVSFVQNHPEDPGRVVVYSAPEGDEVATYTRGTARLVAGEARVPLAETFRWVTNPDIGLTAHLTPHGDCQGLYVASLGTGELVVRERGGGTSDVAFDYLVFGLRLGFEEASPVAPKEREAPLPSPVTAAQFYAQHPELRRHNALERFKQMTASVRGTTPEGLDLSGAARLREAVAAAGWQEIGTAGPEAPEPERLDPAALEPDAGAMARAPGQPADLAGDHRDETAAPATDAGTPAGVTAATIPVDREGNVYGRSFRPSAAELASLVVVAEPVEAGDVLVIEPERPGLMGLGRMAADPAVFGIVAAAPGVVLGQTPPAETAGETGPGEVEPEAGGWPDEETGALPLQAPVAVSGVVLCKADAGYGSIRPGDLLTTAPTPGHAMRADDPLLGTILGKALEPLDTGTGRIRVLVMLR
jgi:hypothetical protein